MSERRRMILDVLFPCTDEEEQQKHQPHTEKKNSATLNSNKDDEFASGRNDHEHTVCSICLENLGDRPSITTLCGHANHRECLMNWLCRDHNECPQCRRTNLWDEEKYQLIEAQFLALGGFSQVEMEGGPSTTTPLEMEAATADSERSQYFRFRLAYFILFGLLLQIVVFSIAIRGMSDGAPSQGGGGPFPPPTPSPTATPSPLDVPTTVAPTAGNGTAPPSLP